MSLLNSIKFHSQNIRGSPVQVAEAPLLFPLVPDRAGLTMGGQPPGPPARGIAAL